MAVVVDAYAAAVARRLGIPQDDIEDVVQEARIRQLRAPSVPLGILARRAAIDWLRKWGRHSRKGNDRIAVRDIDVMHIAPYEAVEQVYDFLLAWPHLSPRQQRCIRMSVAGQRTTNAEQQAVSKGRKRLRVLTAGG